MRGQTITFGLLGGLFFFAHAMINNSHAWPLVWPTLAGVLAVWTARSGSKASYVVDLKRAAGAGLIAGAVFLAATALTLSQMNLSTQAGYAGLALAAVLGMVAAVIAGGLTHPVARQTGA